MDTDSKDGMITIIRYNVSCTMMIRAGATLFSELTKGFIWKGYGGMQNGGISSFLDPFLPELACPQYHKGGIHDH